MARPPQSITPDELDRLNRIRGSATYQLDVGARNWTGAPEDRIGRVAWAYAYAGDHHPATRDAVAEARNHRHSWRQIAAALGEDLTDPKTEGRVQRRWSRRLTG